MTLRRTGEGTAPALHAVHGVEVLQGVDVLAVGGVTQFHGLELHRAGGEALAAADAGGGLGEPRLLFAKGEDGVILLEDIQVVRRQGGSHHRTAHEELLRLFLVAAGEVDDLFDRRADRDDDIHRILDRAAVHGQPAADQRHAGLEIAGDEGDGADVHHEAAGVAGQRAHRHIAAGACLDEDLLGALRVRSLQRQNADLVADVNRAVGDLSERLDGVGLVVLDADDHAVDVEEFLDGHDAGDDVPAVLEHLAVVGGDVGLTLGGVDDHGVDVLVGRDVQLDGGREARAAEAYQPRLAHGGDQLGEALDVRRLDVRRDALLAVALDEDRVYAVAARHDDLVDLLDLAGHRGVDGRADEGLAARDDLTDVDGIADLDQRHARRADVLGHGQGDHRRHGQLDARRVGGVLVMRSVYPAVGAVGPLRKAELRHCIISFIPVVGNHWSVDRESIYKQGLVPHLIS